MGDSLKCTHWDEKAVEMLVSCGWREAVGMLLLMVWRAESWSLSPPATVPSDCCRLHAPAWLTDYSCRVSCCHKVCLVVTPGRGGASTGHQPPFIWECNRCRWLMHRNPNPNCSLHLCRQCTVRNRNMIRYDTRCYFNVQSKADMGQLNLPHGTNN